MNEPAAPQRQLDASDVLDGLSLLVALCHAVAILYFVRWLSRLLSKERTDALERSYCYDTYRISGWLRPMHYTCVAAAAAASVIPLFQLYAHLTKQLPPFFDEAIAPVELEGLGLVLAAAAFLLLSAILWLEVQLTFMIDRRWSIRVPLLIVASCEGLRLIFVWAQEVQQQEPLGYFFWLYVAYVGLQAFLAAALCLLHRDPWSDNLLLEEVSLNDEIFNIPNGHLLGVLSAEILRVEAEWRSRYPPGAIRHVGGECVVRDY